MKTIREWLEELPEPYRTQALKNNNEYYVPYRYKTDNMASAINFAFCWGDTQEGQEYWSKIHEKYSN